MDIGNKDKNPAMQLLRVARFNLVTLSASSFSEEDTEAQKGHVIVQCALAVPHSGYSLWSQL